MNAPASMPTATPRTLWSAGAAAGRRAKLPPVVAWAGAGLLISTAAVAGLKAGVPVARLLALLVIAPLAEELIFRAGLQRLLVARGWAPAPAIAGATLGFAVAHGLLQGPVQALLVMPPSLALGLLYAKTRRLRHCVVLHAGMNGAWILAWLLASTAL